VPRSANEVVGVHLNPSFGVVAFPELSLKLSKRAAPSSSNVLDIGARNSEKAATLDCDPTAQIVGAPEAVPYIAADESGKFTLR